MLRSATSYRGVVEPDLPGAAAEAARRVGQDDVTALGEDLRLRRDGLLAAAEAVREHDGGRRLVVAGQVERGVELDGVVAGAGGDHGLLGAHVLGGQRGSGRGGHGDPGEQDGKGGERGTGAGARP